MKNAGDQCDHNYECLSRCCHEGACCKFDQCIEYCTINKECNEDCCSFSYCTSSNNCESRKQAGDVCNNDSECERNLYCTIDPRRMKYLKYREELKNSEVSIRVPKKNGNFEFKSFPAEKYGICHERIKDPDYGTLISISIISFALVIISIAIYFLCI